MSKGKKRVRKKKKRVCADCGIEVISTRFLHSVDKTFCRSCTNRGARNYGWKGGIIKDHGYVAILMKDHPYANGYGYIHRSHLIWGKATGHYLQGNEVIHHIDGDRTNDSLDNLQLMTRSEHVSLHKTGKNHHNYKHGKYVGEKKFGKYVPINERERTE